MAVCGPIATHSTYAYLQSTTMTGGLVFFKRIAAGGLAGVGIVCHLQM